MTPALKIARIAACLAFGVLAVCSYAQEPISIADAKHSEPADVLIANRTPGLPAWTPADVAALRTELLEAANSRRTAIAAGQDPAEYDSALGNFVGQWLARGLPFDGAVHVDHPDFNEPGVAAAVLDFLAWYEHYRHTRSEPEKYDYTPTQYPVEVVAFIERHGRSLAQIQALAPVMEGGIAGGTGCYVKTTFAVGLTLLSGATTIWVADGTDDAYVDVPLGFSAPWFQFPGCNTGFYGSTQVRVSSNGYISFFQVSEGAEAGDLYLNDPIPDQSTPAGFIAPWWDDLFVAPAQGASDRVSYKTEGVAPNRVMTIEYSSMSRLGGLTTDFHTFQVKLFEYDQSVELHYGGWSADTSDSATIGMESNYQWYFECGPNCDNLNDTRPNDNYRFRPYTAYNEDECPEAHLMCSNNTQAAFRFLTQCTNDGESTCDGNTGARDIWFKYRAPCSGVATFKTCAFDQGFEPNTNPAMSVHSACPGTTANQLACNNDYGPDGDCHPTQARIDLNMSAGQLVYIRVTHFGTQLTAQAVDFQVVFTPANPPANDHCQDAEVLISGEGALGNVSCASHSPGILCAGGSGDVYYRFTAPSCSGVLRISLCGTEAVSGLHSAFSVHTSCPATHENTIECVTDQYPDPNPCGQGPATDAQADVPMQAGQTVLIRVLAVGGTCDGYDDGRFNLMANWIPSNVAPLNNTIAGAKHVGCNTSTFGSTCNSNVQAVPVCSGVVSNTVGVWYTMEGDGGMNSVSTCNSNFDTKISVFRGPTNALVCVAGNNDDPGCGLNPWASRVDWLTTAGERYYILVHGFAFGTLSDRGEFELVVTGNAAPDNDLCGDALAVGVPSTTLGNLTCATSDTPQCTIGEPRDVWYSVTIPCDGMLQVDTFGTYAMADLDSTLSLFSACGGAALDCNDDCFGVDCNGHPLDARLNRAVQAGEQFLIRVSQFGLFDYAPFTLNVSIHPHNDDCSAAASIADGSTPFCSYGANTDGPLTCLIRSDVWYRYRASCTGMLTVSTCGSGFNTALAVYNGWGCPPGAEAHCSDDGCGDDASVTFPVNIGELYLIRVGGPFGSGQGVINISCSVDACGGVQRADANCDGLINNFDIDPFIAGILEPLEPVAPATYSASVPDAQACWDKRACWGDTDCNGLFNNFDIDPFVNCLLLPVNCTPCP
ncbi:MAG: hypothetical protein IPM64_06045 [Phycisphaerales bacterium]|nr:hypothetical protein [Phycisphaerales bacterium]